MSNAATNQTNVVEPSLTPKSEIRRSYSALFGGAVGYRLPATSDLLPNGSGSLDYFQERHRFLMNPVAARRFHRLETFDGDADIGYVKPDKSAVSAIGDLLRTMFSLNPKLESPVISPAKDGEILVSWRLKSTYLILHFTDGSDFEWTFNAKKPISGFADARNRHTQRELASILTHLFNAASITEIARQPVVGTAVTNRLPDGLSVSLPQAI